MKLYSYPVTIEREGKQYYAYSESLPGVYGLGSSVEEARESISRGIRLYIRHCRSKRKQVPPPRDVYAATVTLAV
jgi:predicted RNase H-like HicB family nuclease